jgi:multiple sugar transport system permease protein
VTGRRRADPFLVVGFVLLLVWVVISVLPLYWMFTTALKTPTMAAQMPPELIPSDPTLQNFQRLFATPNLWRWTFNSLFVATVTTLLYLLISAMAGYAFAKRRFPGRDVLFVIYVGTMMVPGFVTLVTTYQVVADLGWTNSYPALILPELASPFGAFLMRQFIRGLPSELFDAARVDGAGEWGVFVRIVLPLVVPALAVLAVFHFSYMWNSFIWPLTVTSDDAMRTLPVGLSGLQHGRGINYPLLMAGASFAAMPMLLIFFAAQRFFLKGITVGGVKG